MLAASWTATAGAVLAGCASAAPATEPAPSATASAATAAAGTSTSSRPPVPGSATGGDYPELDEAASIIGGAWTPPEQQPYSACADGEPGARAIVIVRPADGATLTDPGAAGAALAAHGYPAAEPENPGALAFAVGGGSIEVGEIWDRPGLAWLGPCKPR